jgi:hypothetical protein
VQETATYIASRIRTAGGEASRLFTREAVMLIHERAHGIPRTISVICDNALVTGMALGKQPVGKDIVNEVCRDFDLALTAAPMSVPAIEFEDDQEDAESSDEIAAADSGQDTENVKERSVRPIGLGRR